MEAHAGPPAGFDPYRLLAERSADVAYVTARTGEVEWISPSVERVLGWRPDQLLGTMLRSLVHPDDRGIAEHWRARLLAPAPVGEAPGGTSAPVRMQRGDGSYVWCRVTITAVRDDAGDIVAMTGLVHDVDDLVRARNEAADASTHLHAVLDAFIDPRVTLVALRGEDGSVRDFVIEDANVPAADYYGIAPEGMIGRTVTDLMGADVAPYDIERARDVLESGVALVLNDDWSKLRHRQGERPTWLDVRVSPVDRNRVSYTWRDVTERHEAREEITRTRDLLRTVIDSQVDPHVLLRAVRDTSGGIVDFIFEDANEAAAVFEGFERVADILGASMMDTLIHKDEARADLEECARVLTTGNRVVANDVPTRGYFDEMGRAVVVDVRIVPIDKDRVSYAWRDVTQRHLDRQELLQAQTALERSHDLLRTVIDGHVDPHVILSPVRSEDGAIVDFRYEDANAAAAAFEGRERRALLGATLREIYRDEREAEEDIADCVRALASGDVISRNDSRTLGYTDAQGRQEFVDIRVVPLGADRLLYTWRDVTDRHFDEQLLARSEERFRLLAENMSDVIVLVQHGVIAWVSPSVERVVGAAPEEFQGMDPVDLIHPEDVDGVRAAVAGSPDGAPPRVRCRLRGSGGGYHWVDVEANAVPGAAVPTLVLSARIVDAEVAALQALQQQARHDELTGLVNRHAIFDHLGRTLAGEVRSGKRLAMVFCDLDGFKAVNDDHGHGAGDELLRVLGQRLQASVRSGDMVARIGGDEFLVVLDGVQDLDNAMEIAEKLRRQMTEPVDVLGATVAVGASVGVTLAERGEDIDSIVARADDAMYLAKRRGKGAVVAIPGTTQDR